MARNPNKGCHLEEVEGDLFDCPDTDSMAHCVSQDMHMSKGIAVRFKNEFRGVEDLHMQYKGVGDVAVLERGGRYIYYLVTKREYHHKPTYGTLRSSLQAMKMHCLRHRVGNLSMPAIGCGLDKLDWYKVSEMIKDVFKHTNVHITVYFYKPPGNYAIKRKAEFNPQQPISTKKLKMQQNLTPEPRTTQQIPSEESFKPVPIKGPVDSDSILISEGDSSDNPTPTPPPKKKKKKHKNKKKKKKERKKGS